MSKWTPGKWGLTPFIALVSFAAAAYDANGVGLGATEAEVLARFPGAHCRALDWHSEAADRRCDDPDVRFGGVPARVTFYLKKGQVQAFEARFETREVERVAAFLKTRYGSPASESRESVPVRGGRAMREVYKVQWRKGEVRAVLTAVMERRRASLAVSRGDFEEEIYRLR